MRTGHSQTMTGWRGLVALGGSVVSLVILAGCGSGESASETIAKNRQEASAAPSATSGGSSQPKTGAGANPNEPAGTPAPEALSAFRCAKSTDDGWVAAGYVSNEAKIVADFQVTVYVGPADGTTRRASTQRIDAVKPDGSTRFEITDIAADGEDCHVQVLRLDA